MTFKLALETYLSLTFLAFLTSLPLPLVSEGNRRA